MSLAPQLMSPHIWQPNLRLIKDFFFGVFILSSIIFTRKNIVHSNHMFVTIVQLVSKAIQFASTLVWVLCDILVASVHSCIYY
jgi:hypothetical protein